MTMELLPCFSLQVIPDNAKKSRVDTSLEKNNEYELETVDEYEEIGDVNYQDDSYYNEIDDGDDGLF